MRRVVWSAVFVFVVAAALLADSGLRIVDVGLRGYSGGNPSAVRLIVRNPSAQAQTIHLRIASSNENGFNSAISTDVRLNGNEQRELELPLIMGGKTTVTADATIAGAVSGHDEHEGLLRQSNLIVLMCGSDSLCKAVQSQIQFSGTIEERVDKNRQVAFEIVNAPVEHWWAYSAARTIVLARPIADFTPAQRNAIEGFLRRGGRLVLLEDQIADPDFLSPYRQGPAAPSGAQVGKGMLFRVSSLSANELGNLFVGQNLQSLINQSYSWNFNQTGWLTRRFATEFDFPRLRWILTWLAIYTVIVGIVNFAVLRRLHRLELGWISVCVLALLFAGGFYLSSAMHRPKHFRLDNLATYYLDSRSPLAIADYDLRISAPNRRDVRVSVDDAVVFTSSNFADEEPNGQIWSEMNRQAARARQTYDVRLGPPSQVDLMMLKWSFHDLNLEGLRTFSGTVHFVAPNRLRNDTGQRFDEAAYLDYNANALYALPALPPGEEISLDAIIPKQIFAKDGTMREQDFVKARTGKQPLQEAAASVARPFARAGRVFAGLSEGPALPVELNVPHQESGRSLFIVVME